MKRFIIRASILLVIMGVFLLIVIKFGGSGDAEVEPITAYRFDSDLDTEPQTIQSGKVKLVFDPTKATFVFTDKYGNEWLSNPVGSEEVVNDASKSILLVQYKNNAGAKNDLSSREHSVNKGNYTYEKVDESTIRIDFTIGLISKTYFIPTVMSEERFLELSEMVSKETKNMLRDWYRKYDPETLDEKFPDKAAKLRETYPDLNEGKKVYELYDNTQDYQKEDLEAGLIADINYSHEDWEKDNEYGQVEGSKDILPTVNVSMFLKLENDELVVEIPYNSIVYYDKYPITEFRVLPFFCAANKSQNGYLFVPDGSGAIINFNNGKITQNNYSARMYGWDYGAPRDIVVSDPIARFPVYGASFTDSDASLLCVIEEGDAYATVEADVAGRTYDFNYVTNVFTVVHNQLADVGSRSIHGYTVYEESIPKDEKLSLRYIGVDSSDYVDMAKEYRSYLLNRYPELKESSNENLPVAVELLGAVAKMQHVLGFPKELPYALTTYNEMDTILKDLKANGWENINVILNGWFNKGVDHKWADDISLIGKLGKKKNFKDLLSNAKGMGYNVSLKADFMFERKDTLMDSYHIKRDSARFLSREVAEFKPISDIWYGELEDGESYYLAKPSVTLKTIDKFLKDASSLGSSSVAFASIGNKLGADYFRKNPVSRQKAMNQQVEKLAALKGNKNIIYKGNAYALPYADIVVDFPVQASKASIEDGSIPFFPIALHGYVRYTGDSINITNDYITNLLRSAETGAGLYFIFMDAETEELQESAHTEYFGANYEAWKKQANELYRRYTNDFGNLTKKTIEGHRMVNDNVYVTKYSDGTEVYVNYRTTDYSIGSFTIPAQDWVVVKGGN